MSVLQMTFGEEYYFMTDTGYRQAVMEAAAEQGKRPQRCWFWEPQGEMDIFTQYFSKLFKRKR